MTDAEIRTAWRRLKDPLGSPARTALLAVGLGGVGVYAGSWLRADWRLPAVLVVGAAAAFYLGSSLRIRAIARNGSAAEMRARLAEDGVEALRKSGTLLARALLWLGIGAWAWTALAGAAPFPIAESVPLAVFLAALGTLLGAALLLEWLRLPRVRADLERLAEGDGSVPGSQL